MAARQRRLRDVPGHCTRQQRRRKRVRVAAAAAVAAPLAASSCAHCRRAACPQPLGLEPAQHIASHAPRHCHRRLRRPAKRAATTAAAAAICLQLKQPLAALLRACVHGVVKRDRFEHHIEWLEPARRAADRRCGRVARNRRRAHGAAAAAHAAAAVAHANGCRRPQ
eukprot:357031-Chlamydomonas_euryale.AAC.6